MDIKKIIPSHMIPMNSLTAGQYKNYMLVGFNFESISTTVQLIDMMGDSISYSLVRLSLNYTDGRIMVGHTSYTQYLQFKTIPECVEFLTNKKYKFYVNQLSYSQGSYLLAVHIQDNLVNMRNNKIIDILNK